MRDEVCQNASSICSFESIEYLPWAAAHVVSYHQLDNHEIYLVHV